MENTIAAHLLKTAKVVEQQIDNEISELDKFKENSDEAELEELRRKRFLEFRKIQEKKQILISNGHGKLEELSDEPSFFQAAKNSSRLVCHFFDINNRICFVIDKVLEKLAAKYIGTRFVKVKAEKVPFLIKRLNIRKIPTIGISIDAQMTDFIRVVDEFSSSDSLKVEVVEKRLLSTKVLNSLVVLS